MGLYYFHLIYDDYSKLDQQGCMFSSPNGARVEAAAMVSRLLLEARILRKSQPRKIAVLLSGNVHELVALVEASDFPFRE